MELDIFNIFTSIKKMFNQKYLIDFFKKLYYNIYRK